MPKGQATKAFPDSTTVPASKLFHHERREESNLGVFSTLLNETHADESLKGGFFSRKKSKRNLATIRESRRLSILVESQDIERGEMHEKWSSLTLDSRIQRGGISLMTTASLWERRSWLGYFNWILFAVAIQLIFGIPDFAFPDGKPACDVSLTRNISMCGLETTLSTGSTHLKFLSAFILGGFLTGSVHLWLTRRTAYAALCGATRNLLINVCSIIPDQYDKELMARWALVGFELSVLKSRGLIDSNEGKDYLEKINVIEGDEWDAMVPGDRHTTVWFWIQAKAERLTQNESISEMRFQTICNAVTLSRDRANDLMSSLDRDQPPPYVFICALLIDINLLFVSLATGIKWAIWMHDTNGRIWTEPRMYAAILSLFLFTSIYAMLFA
jgi:hypothetical protein